MLKQENKNIKAGMIPFVGATGSDQSAFMSVEPPNQSMEDPDILSQSERDRLNTINQTQQQEARLQASEFYTGGTINVYGDSSISIDKDSVEVQKPPKKLTWWDKLNIATSESIKRENERF